MDWDDLFLGIPDPTSPSFATLCAFCHAHDGAVLTEIPWLTALIATSEDFATMLVFVRNSSGARLYVSRDLDRFRARVSMGLSAETHARILAHAPPSLLVDVPSAWGVYMALRRVAIRSAVARGLDRHGVARRFGVSERSLRS